MEYDGNIYNGVREEGIGHNFGHLLVFQHELKNQKFLITLEKKNPTGLFLLKDSLILHTFFSRYVHIFSKRNFVIF